jgi:hypothetical protein
MTEQQLKYYLSSPRFNVYLAKTSNDFGKAYRLYKVNIELSEAFYPILSVLEISLRNAVHETLKTHFQDEYWFKNSLPVEFLPFVSDATQKLSKRYKNITPDRIVAELTFGFGTDCLIAIIQACCGSRYELFLITAKTFTTKRYYCRRIVPHQDTTQQNLSLRTNFCNLQDIENQYNEMLTFLTWFDNDLPKLLTDIDRFNDILKKAKAI